MPHQSIKIFMTLTQSFHFSRPTYTSPQFLSRIFPDRHGLLFQERLQSPPLLHAGGYILDVFALPCVFKGAAKSQQLADVQETPQKSCSFDVGTSQRRIRKNLIGRECSENVADYDCVLPSCCLHELGEITRIGVCGTEGWGRD